MAQRRTYWHPRNSANSDDQLCFCPLLTCYFAFSLDTAASVDFLDDPEATSAAQKITSGTYIGLAEQVGGQWLPLLLSSDLDLDLLGSRSSHAQPPIPSYSHTSSQPRSTNCRRPQAALCSTLNVYTYVFDSLPSGRTSASYPFQTPPMA